MRLLLNVAAPFFVYGINKRDLRFFYKKSFFGEPLLKFHSVTPT